MEVGKSEIYEGSKSISMHFVIHHLDGEGSMQAFLHTLQLKYSNVPFTTSLGKTYKIYKNYNNAIQTD